VNQLAEIVTREGKKLGLEVQVRHVTCAIITCYTCYVTCYL
jgi:hypothetical protein